MHDVPVDIIAAQLDAVLSDLNVRAVKIGMLSSPAIIEAVADKLSVFGGPIVLDPVMVSKSGARLLQQEALDALRVALAVPATWVELTPDTYILEAGSLYDLERLFAGVVILSLLGVLVSAVIGLIERRMLNWRA